MKAGERKNTAFLRIVSRTGFLGKMARRTVYCKRCSGCLMSISSVRASDDNSHNCVGDLWLTETACYSYFSFILKFVLLKVYKNGQSVLNITQWVGVCECACVCIYIGILCFKSVCTIFQK